MSQRVWILTILRNHSQGDNTASILDQLDDVTVRELNDRAPVYSWDPIADMQKATAVSGTALNDAADFMWNHWKHVLEDTEHSLLGGGIILLPM